MINVDMEPNGEEPQSPELPTAAAELPIGDPLVNLPEPALALHLAMVHAGGDYKKAAAALQLTQEKLKRLMRQFPELVTRWLRNPGKQRDKALPAFAGKQITEEEAEKIMEQKHRQGLILLGLKEKSADLAVNMQAYHVRHQARSMGILNGGLVRAAMETMEMVDRLKAQPYDDETSLDGVLVKSGAKATDEMILRALDAYGRKVLEYGNAEVLRRKLQAEMGGAGQGKKQRPKFGGAPMRTQVLAQPGSNVTFIAPNNPTSNESAETTEDKNG